MDKNTIILAFIYLIGITLLLAFNEINYRKLNVKGEISRKFAHFVATLASIPIPYIFSSHWYVLILAVIFFLVLWITQYSSVLQSIHGVERKSMGSYLLPLSIYGTFLVSELAGSKLLYILPMLILGISDPMAAIVGISLEKYNHRIIIFGIDTQKSMFGSGAFFISSLIISSVAIYFNREVFDATSVLMSLSIAAATTLGEMFSWKGSDNLTVPLTAILVLMIYI